MHIIQKNDTDCFIVVNLVLANTYISGYVKHNSVGIVIGNM